MRDVGEERESKTRVTGNLQQVCLQALQVGSHIEGRSERRTKGRKVTHLDTKMQILRPPGVIIEPSRGRFWVPKVGRKSRREQSREKVAKRTHNTLWRLYFGGPGVPGEG